MSTKVIVVTGGAGHVGSHLVERLAAHADNRVISLDDYSNGSLNNHVAKVDYRNGNTKDISKYIKERPDLVYHLGEYARISTSFEDIETVFDQNIRGTFAVLQFCRHRGAGKLVYAASSTKMADTDKEPKGRFQSPYAFTKATNVDLINAYDGWYKHPFVYAIAYFFNVYGPREVGVGKYATVVEKFKQQYLRGEPLSVSGSGRQERRFTHVDDTVRGLMLVGDEGKGDDYQLGSEIPLTILRLVELFGVEPVITDGDPGRSSTPLDTSKMDALGWKPKKTIEKYIADFIAENPRRSPPA